MSKRNYRTPEEKLELIQRIRREAFESQEKTATVCRRYNILPSQFYQWQNRERKGLLVPVEAQLSKPSPSQSMSVFEIGAPTEKTTGAAPFYVLTNKRGVLELLGDLTN